MQIKLIFVWKVLHLDSFSNRGRRQLGNGLLVLPITTDTNNAMNQSKLEGNACNRRQARENGCEQVMTVVGFTSDWLRKWREFFDKSQRGQMQNQSKPELLTTFEWKLFFCTVWPVYCGFATNPQRFSRQRRVGHVGWSNKKLMRNFLLPFIQHGGDDVSCKLGIVNLSKVRFSKNYIT